MSNFQESNLLFVYGSLKSDRDNEYRHALFHKSTFLGEASVEGYIETAHDFPRGFHEPGCGCYFGGELYQIDDESLFDLLDVYEGCSNNDKEPYEYFRIKVPAILNNGSKVMAHFYQYNFEFGS